MSGKTHGRLRSFGQRRGRSCGINWSDVVEVYHDRDGVITDVRVVSGICDVEKDLPDVSGLVPGDMAPMELVRSSLLWDSFLEKVSRADARRRQRGQR